jgi:hypothetical protein
MTRSRDNADHYSGSTSASDLASGTLAVARMADETVISSGFQRYTSSDVYNQTATFKTPIAYNTISNLTVGDTVYFGFVGSSTLIYQYGSGSSYTIRYVPYGLYHHTSSLSAGASNTGTSIMTINVGRNATGSETTNNTYAAFNITGAFLATQATHYVGMGYKTYDIGLRHTMMISDGLFYYYFIIKGDRVL